MSKRIGIYAGVFDPVHAGHLAFALQAIEEAQLDKLYFLPERRPPRKQGVEHFGHRVAMLKRAAAPHVKFDVLELPDISFSVKRTLPRLQRQFPGDQLVFLFGSDTVAKLPTWPNAEQLLAGAELVIGARYDDTLPTIEQAVAGWPAQPRALTAFTSYAPDISSGKVRDALYRRRPVRGLLSSVQRYSDSNWLYVSVSSR